MYGRVYDSRDWWTAAFTVVLPILVLVLLIVVAVIEATAPNVATARCKYMTSKGVCVAYEVRDCVEAECSPWREQRTKP